MLWESGRDRVEINLGMMVREGRSVVLTLLLAIVVSGCGKKPAGDAAVQPLQDDVEALAAPVVASPEDVAPSAVPAPSAVVAEPHAPSAEPVVESSEPEKTSAGDDASADNAQVVDAIIEQRERGDFAGARNLAIRALERDLPAALALRVETLLAENQQFAREAPGWQAAIELLAGGRSEQRIARNTLLRGGQGAAILMNRALRQATGELFTQLVELLSQQGNNQMLPTLLMRYENALASGADTTRLHAALMTMPPALRPDLDLAALEALAGLLLYKECELFDRKASETLILFFTQSAYYVMQRAGTTAGTAATVRRLLHDVKGLPMSASLRIRMHIATLDCAFLAGDYAGALEALDAHKGVFDEDWQAVVRNKLKAHLAERAHRYEEAIALYRNHIESVKSFYRTGIEDPKDGSTVCREFVLGVNEKRIGDLWAALPAGAAESEAAYGRARVQYQAALDKMAGDHDNCYYQEATEALAALAPTK